MPMRPASTRRPDDTTRFPFCFKMLFRLRWISNQFLVKRSGRTQKKTAHTHTHTITNTEHDGTNAPHTQQHTSRSCFDRRKESFWCWEFTWRPQSAVPNVSQQFRRFFSPLMEGNERERETKVDDESFCVSCLARAVSSTGATRLSAAKSAVNEKGM